MAKKTVSQLPVAESMGEHDVLLMETQLATKCITKNSLLQDVNATLATKANTKHTHAIGDITDLQTKLKEKANTADLADVATTGSYNDLTDTPEAYELPQANANTLGGVKIGNGLAIDETGVLNVSTHNHEISNISGLNTALAEKAELNHTHEEYLTNAKLIDLERLSKTTYRCELKNLLNMENYLLDNGDINIDDNGIVLNAGTGETSTGFKIVRSGDIEAEKEIYFITKGIINYDEGLDVTSLSVEFQYPYSNGLIKINPDSNGEFILIEKYKIDIVNSVIARFWIKNIDSSATMSVTLTNYGYYESTDYNLDNNILIELANQPYKPYNAIYEVGLNFNELTQYIENLINVNNENIQTQINSSINSYDENLLLPGKWLKDKKVVFYGTSITENGETFTNRETGFEGSGFLNILANKFGLNFINKGVGGSTITDLATSCMSNDARLNGLPTDGDVYLIEGGINDWLQWQIPNGGFREGLIKIINYIRTNMPTAVIIVWTPHFCLGYNSETGEHYEIVNERTLKDFVNEIVSVCDEYHVPCINMYTQCGWDATNISTYINNEGKFLHPNLNGGKRIASILADGLIKYCPIF